MYVLSNVFSNCVLFLYTDQCIDAKFAKTALQLGPGPTNAMCWARSQDHNINKLLHTCSYENIKAIELHRSALILLF